MAPGVLWFKQQQWFATVCGSFGQIDGVAEFFDGDRLTVRQAQRAAVGQLPCWFAFRVGDDRPPCDGLRTIRRS